MAAKKIAWITGGGTGIGLGATKVLASEGWTVVISGRRTDVLDQVAKDVGSNVEIVALDVSDAAKVEQAAQTILKKHGRIDLLVNSAGLNVTNRTWADLTTPAWDQVVDINLNGLMYCIRAVLPAMRAQKSGTVVNISSWAGKFPSRVTGPAYSATKHAVVALTHSFNQEEFRNGLRACALCPAEVATDIMKKRPVPPTAEEMARMLQIEDLGRTIAFVANMPPNVCLNEIIISPVWNRTFL